MSEIKGFLFDYDGVITAQSGGNNPSELLANVLSLNSEEVGGLFMSFWPAYLRGKISEEQLWQMIESKTGQTISADQRGIWTKWEQLQPQPEMVNFVHEIRSQGYPAGLLTNVTPTTEEEVRSHGGYDGFDFLVRSCKVGYAKPDKEIYDIALKKFNGLKPEEVVFVDDRERFLVPARALGMHAILAVDAEQIIRDMRMMVTL